MKYLVFSDLHGSKWGLSLLECAVSFHRPDVILCLGDILYGAYDGDARKCIEYLSSKQRVIIGVRGNCDTYYDHQNLGFALPESQVLFFKGHRLLLAHVPFFSSGKGDIVMYGHTHHKHLYEDNGVIFLNPGSIGKPRDDCASYAIIDEQCIYLYDAETSKMLKSLQI